MLDDLTMPSRLADAQAEVERQRTRIAELEAEQERLHRWKALLEATPGEVAETIRERAIESDALAPIVASWRAALQKAECAECAELRAWRVQAEKGTENAELRAKLERRIPAWACGNPPSGEADCQACGGTGLAGCGCSMGTPSVYGDEAAELRAHLDRWQAFFERYEHVVVPMLAVHFGNDPLPQELKDVYKQLLSKEPT
jgi:hypothetical protein